MEELIEYTSSNLEDINHAYTNDKENLEIFK